MRRMNWTRRVERETPTGWGRDLLMRIGVAGFAMMNVMIPSVAVWSGAEAATRDMFHWISAPSRCRPWSLPASRSFPAPARIRPGGWGMDVPISLALILASAISVYETVNSGRHAYFDAAVMLCLLPAGRAVSGLPHTRCRAVRGRGIDRARGAARRA